MYRLTWFGHAALGLQTEKFHVLVDPYLSGNAQAKVKPDSLPADFILVTHGHDDHLGDTVAIARRTGALVISVAEIGRWLRNQGVKAHSQHIGGGFQHPFGYLKLTFATHGSSMPDGSYGGNPCGFLLTTNTGEKLYFAGDTGLFGDMRLIGEEGIDLAVLPIGDNYTMGPADALRAVKLLCPRHVVPIHHLKQDAEAWCQRVQAETSAAAHPLKPGDVLEL